MGENRINSLFNVHEKYKKVNIINSYRFGGGIPLGNIISRWKMDGNSNDSVDGNGGTDTDITYVTGKVGQAASFNGLTSKVFVGDKSNLTFNQTPFTFSALINRDTTSGIQMIFCKDGDLSVREYQFRLENTQLQFVTIAGGVMVIGATIGNTTGQWYHIGMTNNGGVLDSDYKFYLDGLPLTQIPVVGSNTGITDTSANFTIGHSDRPASGNYFDGKIDEGITWDVNLSDSEMLKLATDQLNGIDINP